jgi:hypothetical protein
VARRRHLRRHLADDQPASDDAGARGGGPRGYDAGKKIKGSIVEAPRSVRHLLTDTTGLPVAVLVHEADIQDRDGGPALLDSIRSTCPWLRHIVADGG